MKIDLSPQPYEFGPLSQRAGSRNLHKLLQESYPDIGLDEAKFERLPSLYPLFPYFERLHCNSLIYLKQTGNYWLQNQRAVLESYATRMNFDPLIPDNWYSVHLSNVLSQKVSVITC